jgi:class 3 adenylate cyclase/tetratricopeptide (TPR) repeat protein
VAVTGSENAAQAERPPRDAERRQLTVMFCDLVGSTRLSAALDPEDMRTVLDAFLNACETSVSQFGGMVGNYLGDGLLAYFGYPAADEDDAERAVHAARAVIAAVAALKILPQPALQARVGIATGLVVSRDIGADPKQAVVGETLNLAARLQEVAPIAGIAVAEATARLLGRRFRLEPGGPVALKGFSGPTRFWTVAGTEDTATRFAAKRPHGTKLIGREAELAALCAQARAAWAGHGSATLLRGEAGIGKSRLAAALAAEILPAGSTPGISSGFIVFQCSPFHRESVLYPFRAQFLHTSRLTPDDAPDLKLHALESFLTRVRPEDPDALALLATGLSIPVEARVAQPLASPAEQRRRVLATILNILGSLAGQQNILVLFEDAHWADSTSIELLAAMIAQLRAAPAFIIVTARPEFDPEWCRNGQAATIDLGHLDEPSIVELVRQATGRRMAASVERGIVARADGVPLFAEELALTFRDAGGADETAKTPEIPATLKDSLMARLDRLGAAKDIAQIGAAVGREFSRTLLSCVADRSDASLDEGLAKLEAADLIVVSSTPSHRFYRFKHALVRDAAYESLLKSRRLTIHLGLANALQERFPAEAAVEPEVVARHFGLARQNVSAISWWCKAGELAMRRAGYAEAAQHFGRAIDLADNTPGAAVDKMLRVKLQISYGQALMAVRGYSGAGTAAAFQRAFELATTLEDPALRHPAVHGVWIGAWMHADLPAMHRLAAILADDAKNFPGSPGALFAINDLAMGSWLRGRFQEAKTRFEEVIAGLGGNPDPDADAAARFGIDAGVNAYAFMGLTLWPLGDVDGARQALDEAVARAHRGTQAASIGYAVLIRCMVQAALGETAAVRQQAGEIFRLAAAQGMEQYRAWAGVLYHWARVMEGDDGLDGMAAARRYGEETGVAMLRPFLGAALHATALAKSGRIDAALTVLNDDLAILNATGQTWSEADLYTRLGRILLQQTPPDPKAAKAAFQHAHNVALAQGAVWFADQASEALDGMKQARPGGFAPWTPTKG